MPAHPAKEVLEALGIGNVSPGACTGTWLDTRGPELASVNPATGEILGKVRQATAGDYETVATAASEAFLTLGVLRLKNIEVCISF